MPDPLHTQPLPQSEPSGVLDTQRHDTAAAIGGDDDLAFLTPRQEKGELGRLGHYRILKKLGRGGMGMVFLAEDIKLRRKVALKVMLPRFAADPRYRERFLREARAAAAVKHDHVVTIHAVEEENDIPFIALEYLQGMPLDAFLRKEGLPDIGHVLRIGREMAEGLAAAHEQGLIHRDIKPANVWLEAPNGRVKVLDFGLARIEGSGDASLTASGAVMGTPAYMSPEQGRGEKLDHRSDLYSLGAVLFTLCTGKLPFSGNQMMTLLTATEIERPQSAKQINANVPPELSDLIDRLLAKNPARRPSSAREVAKSLGEIERPAAAPSIVYVPLAVPVQDESNPWADIEEDTPAPERTSAAMEKTIQPVNARRAPLVAGLGIGLAVIAVTIVFLTRGGSTGTPATPGTEHVEKKAPVRKSDPPERPPIADADRRAAQWALKVGGTVSVRLGAQVREITHANGLPTDAFELIEAIFEKNERLTDEDLANLRGLNRLERVRLGACPGFTGTGLRHLRDIASLNRLEWSPDANDVGFEQIEGMNIKRLEIVVSPGLTAAGVRRLRKLPLDYLILNGPYSAEVLGALAEGFSGLRHLQLISETQTDAGVLSLTSYPELTYLRLYGPRLTDRVVEVVRRQPKLQTLLFTSTGLTDEGLKAIADVKTLRKLALKNTKVSETALAAFQKTRPDCDLVVDDALYLPDPDRRAAGWVLMSGGKVRVRLESGMDINVAANEPLPAALFRLILVDLQDIKSLRDDDLARFTGLKHLATLIVKGFHANEQSFDVLHSLPKLANLTLSYSAATDASLQRLKGLKLTQLSLNSCPNVTEATLAAVSDMPLKYLHVNFTNVTDKSFPIVSQFRDLDYLAIGSRHLTDAGLATLEPFPKLVRLELFGAKLSDQAAVDFALRHPSLEQLYLNSIRFSGADLERLAGLKKLKVLNLTLLKLPAANLEALRQALPNCTIVVDSKSISDTGDADRRAAESVLKTGGKVAILHRNARVTLNPGEPLPNDAFAVAGVYFTNLERIVDSDLATLRGLKNLETVDLTGTKVTDAVGDLARELPALRNLTLSATAVTDAGLEKLKGLPLAGVVCNSCPGVTDAGLEHLRSMPLTVLGVALTKVTDRSLPVVAKFRDLSYLALGSKDVTDAGLAALPVYPELHRLILHGPSITDRGVTALAVRQPKLSRLVLYSVVITGDALEGLAASKSLTALDLADIKIPLANVRALQQALPRCEVTVGGKPVPK